VKEFFPFSPITTGRVYDAESNTSTVVQVRTAVKRKWQRYKIRRISRRHSRTTSTVLRISAKSSSIDQAS